MADPTTAPSAVWQTIFTWSGVEIPKPTQTGFADKSFTLLTSALISIGTDDSAPVTPVRETT